MNLLGSTYIKVKKKAYRENPVHLMKGMFPRQLRRHGFQRMRFKNIFWRHTLGVGGVYIFMKEDHIVIDARELSINAICRSLDTLRHTLELIDVCDEAMTARWLRL